MKKLMSYTSVNNDFYYTWYEEKDRYILKDDNEKILHTLKKDETFNDEYMQKLFENLINKGCIPCYIDENKKKNLLDDGAFEEWNGGYTADELNEELKRGGYNE